MGKKYQWLCRRYLGILEVRKLKHHAKNFKLQCKLRLSLCYDENSDDDDDDDDDDDGDDYNMKPVKSYLWIKE
jgi:hypothetical protein